jgi:hypothetical protein
MERPQVNVLAEQRGRQLAQPPRVHADELAAHHEEAHGQRGHEAHVH